MFLCNGRECASVAVGHIILFDCEKQIADVSIAFLINRKPFCVAFHPLEPCNSYDLDLTGLISFYM